MKGDKISVSDSREYVEYNGLKRWKKYSIRTKVRENETDEQAVERAEAFIESRFTKSNEPIPFEQIPINKPSEKESTREETIQAIMTDIENSDTLDELLIWKHMPKLYPETKDFYESKLKALQP